MATVPGLIKNKNMKKILMILIALAVSVTGAYAFIDSYVIKRENLPEEARQMLDEYFPKAKVSKIKIDRHLLKKTDYDVTLTNGTKIEFSNKGKWTSVDCGKRALPDGLVPKTIQRYIGKNHSAEKTVSIVKRNAGYDIGLSSGEVLRFNLLGQFKGTVTDESK